jgi:transcriptional regulator with XRE-family HTH domain
MQNTFLTFRKIIPLNKKTIMFRIKEIIREKGLTVNGLAKQLNVSRVTLSSQINGNNAPTTTTLQKIATALNVHITELFERPAQSDTELTALIEYKKNLYKAESLEQLKGIVRQIEEKQ